MLRFDRPSPTAFLSRLPPNFPLFVNFQMHGHQIWTPSSGQEFRFRGRFFLRMVFAQLRHADPCSEWQFPYQYIRSGLHSRRPLLHRGDRHTDRARVRSRLDSALYPGAYCGIDTRLKRSRIYSKRSQDRLKRFCKSRDISLGKRATRCRHVLPPARRAVGSCEVRDRYNQLQRQ